MSFESFVVYSHLRNLVNTWSLLFQKVDLAGVFAFFSVLSVSRSQFWSYDHENGIKLIPRTFGTNVSSRFLIEGLKIFFETFKVALQCHFLMLGCQNESKTASEISKIHFWGQKIKFSFWLNKCFWNVLQLVKHIQEGYFYIFKVVTHSESYLCRQHKAKKWLKTDLRNFENPFLRWKNQIFLLTQ